MKQRNGKERRFKRHWTWDGKDVGYRTHNSSRGSCVFSHSAIICVRKRENVGERVNWFKITERHIALHKTFAPAEFMTLQNLIMRLWSFNFLVETFIIFHPSKPRGGANTGLLNSTSLASFFESHSHFHRRFYLTFLWARSWDFIISRQDRSRRLSSRPDKVEVLIECQFPRIGKQKPGKNEAKPVEFNRSVSVLPLEIWEIHLFYGETLGTGTMKLLKTHWINYLHLLHKFAIEWLNCM